MHPYHDNKDQSVKDCTLILKNIYEQFPKVELFALSWLPKHFVILELIAVNF